MSNYAKSCRQTNGYSEPWYSKFFKYKERSLAGKQKYSFSGLSSGYLSPATLLKILERAYIYLPFYYPRGNPWQIECGLCYGGLNYINHPVLGAILHHKGVPLLLIGHLFSLDYTRCL